MVPTGFTRFLCTLLVACAGLTAPAAAQDVLIPMNAQQSNHLKAYGAAFWALENGSNVDWLLNYEGGSFLLPASEALEQELRVRGVSYQTLGGGEASQLIARVEGEGSNMSVVRLEKAPNIAVYAPNHAQPWDDAVRLALEYAEVPHDIIYDRAVMEGELSKYDWVHLHHEDFTGQFGKFLRGTSSSRTKPKRWPASTASGR
jgi:hypothetical protein